MPQKIVAGNWKMNNDVEESAALASEILRSLSALKAGNCRVIIFPPFTSILQLKTLIKERHSDVLIGGQNCHWEQKGAFTGEVSPLMLKSAGAQYVLVGHSERRQYFNENNELLSGKIQTAMSCGLNVIYCCGEALSDRKSGRHFNIVKQQIEEGLQHFTGTEECELTIAYEPVWAIGTGETASPEQAQEMHAFIRNLMVKKLSMELASKISILYGGSCNAKNASSLFSQPDIDGGLIGGASLIAGDFLQIINSLKN